MLSRVATSGIGTTVSCFWSPSFPMAAPVRVGFGGSSYFSENSARASPWASSRVGAWMGFAWCDDGVFVGAPSTFISGSSIVWDWSVARRRCRGLAWHPEAGAVLVCARRLLGRRSTPEGIEPWGPRLGSCFPAGPTALYGAACGGASASVSSSPSEGGVVQFVSVSSGHPGYRLEAAAHCNVTRTGDAGRALLAQVPGFVPFVAVSSGVPGCWH